MHNLVSIKFILVENCQLFHRHAPMPSISEGSSVCQLGVGVFKEFIVFLFQFDGFIS
jgi:hypothetical protein